MNKQGNSVLVRVIAVVGALLIMVGATGMVNGRLGPVVGQGSLAAQASGLQPDQVVMTVNGVDVTAEEYLYQVCRSCDNTYTYLSYFGITDLAQELEEGYTAGDYIAEQAKSDAVSTISQTVVVKQWMAEAGITNDENVQTQVDEQLAAIRENYGGEEIFAQQLYLMGISEEYLRDNLAYTVMVQQFYDAYCTAGGALRPNDEALNAYVQEESLVMAKVIMFDGSAITDEEEMEKLEEQADDAEDRIEDAKDKLAEFDAVAAELEQDVTAQIMDCCEDNALCNAVKALKVGECSDVIEYEGCYYLVMVTEMDLDQVAAMMLNAEFSERMATVEVTDAPVMESFNIGDFYTKMMALQSAVAAQTAD